MHLLQKFDIYREIYTVYVDIQAVNSVWLYIRVTISPSLLDLATSNRSHLSLNHQMQQHTPSFSFTILLKLKIAVSKYNKFKYYKRRQNQRLRRSIITEGWSLRPYGALQIVYYYYYYYYYIWKAALTWSVTSYSQTGKMADKVGPLAVGWFLYFWQLNVAVVTTKPTLAQLHVRLRVILYCRWSDQQTDAKTRPEQRGWTYK